MKKTQKMIKQVESENVLEIICDKCGKPIKSEMGSAYKSDWFMMTTGDYFGSDCWQGMHRVMDLCEDCSNELIELLKKNGYNIRDEEFDYSQ
jgi:hypothetical protein